MLPLIDKGGSKVVDVVKLVRDGQARYEWHWLERRDGEVVLRYAVMRDAMKFDDVPPLDWFRRPLGTGPTQDGVRLPASAFELQQIADLVNGSLCTPSMLDQIWLQAECRFDAVVNSGPPSYGIVATMPILDVHRRIEASIQASGGDDGGTKLVSCVGKYWVLDDRLEEMGMVQGDWAACNYGWHARVASGPGMTPGTQVWQRPGFAHNCRHLDSSQTIRLVWRVCEVSYDGGANFEDRYLKEVFDDPDLAKLVSTTGTVSCHRQKGPNPLPTGGYIVLPPLEIVVRPEPPPPEPAPDPTDPSAEIPPSERPLLRKGDDGPWVEYLQHRIIAKGSDIVADGDFGPATDRSVRSLQTRKKLQVDGLVGKNTWEAVDDAEVFDEWHGWGERKTKIGKIGEPGEPPFPPIRGNWGRQQVFGKFRYVPNPNPSNPESIKIVDNWVGENIVMARVPQIAKIPGRRHQGVLYGKGPKNGVVAVHKLVAEQLKALWQRWEDEGLLPYVLTWDGLWNPRFIRGSQSVLSNHANASAFDINASWNGLGRNGAALGQEGTVWPLVEIAYEYGWYWGGKFSRRDAMHFECAVPGMIPNT